MVAKEQLLKEAHLAISNTLTNPQIATLLASYGYHTGRLQEGLQLCASTRGSLQAHGDAYSGKRVANKDFQKVLQEAQLHSNHDMQLARLVLKGNITAHSLLHAIEKRPQSYAGWHVQASEFYARLSATPELQTLVAEWGLTPSHIQQGIQLVQATEVARLQKQAQSGNAALECRQREEAFAALRHWMFTFRRIVWLALAAEPELLATLGVKSITRKPQKKTEEAIQIKIPTIRTENYLTIAAV